MLMIGGHYRPSSPRQPHRHACVQDSAFSDFLHIATALLRAHGRRLAPRWSLAGGCLGDGIFPSTGRRCSALTTLRARRPPGASAEGRLSCLLYSVVVLCTRLNESPSQNRSIYSRMTTSWTGRCLLGDQSQWGTSGGEPGAAAAR